ncbi:MAG: hypothetical protein ACKVH8_04045 [Pirellulales bacterium]
MNDPIVSAIRMILEDSRDHTTMQVSLSDYMQFSTWIDEQLITLQVSQIPARRKSDNQKASQWSTDITNR